MTSKKNISNGHDIKNVLNRYRPPVWEQANGEWTGPSGYCICPKCGETVAHRIGRFCLFTKCPGCGSRMVRQQSSFDHNGLAKGQSTPLAKGHL